MIEIVPVIAGLELHPRGAQIPRALVAAERAARSRRRLWPIDSARQTASSIAMQAPCASVCSVGCAASPSSVTRPLLQCRIGSRSELTQPRRDRSIIAQQRLHGRMRVAIDAVEVGMRARGVARRRVVRGLEHRDDVEQRAVAQRIVHDVEAVARTTAPHRRDRRRTSRPPSARWCDARHSRWCAARPRRASAGGRSSAGRRRRSAPRLRWCGCPRCAAARGRRAPRTT